MKRYYVYYNYYEDNNSGEIFSGLLDFDRKPSAIVQIQKMLSFGCGTLSDYKLMVGDEIKSEVDTSKIVLKEVEENSQLGQV